MAERTIAQIAPTVTDDASSMVYRWVWSPMLALQLLHYSYVGGLVWLEPRYRLLGGLIDPLMYEDHIGLRMHLDSQPHPAILGVHMLMAWAWPGVVLAQRQLAAMMSRAISSVDEDAFQRARTLHQWIGRAMGLLGFVGIAVTPVLALVNRGPSLTTWFLTFQLGFFLPVMALTLYTARQRAISIRYHRFWAEIAFVGPALTSLWVEIAVNLLDYLPLSPEVSELAGTQVGVLLGLLLVMLPAWLSLRQGLRADSTLQLGTV